MRMDFVNRPEYACGQCCKNFPAKRQLKIHIRTHTIVKSRDMVQRAHCTVGRQADLGNFWPKLKLVQAFRNQCRHGSPNSKLFSFLILIKYNESYNVLKLRFWRVQTGRKISKIVWRILQQRAQSSWYKIFCVVIETMEIIAFSL